MGTGIGGHGGGGGGPVGSGSGASSGKGKKQSKVTGGKNSMVGGFNMHNRSSIRAPVRAVSYQKTGIGAMKMSGPIHSGDRSLYDKGGKIGSHKIPTRDASYASTVKRLKANI